MDATEFEQAGKRKYAELEKAYDEERRVRDAEIQERTLAGIQASRLNARQPAAEPAVVHLAESEEEGEVDSVNASSAEEPLAGWVTRKQPAGSKATGSGTSGKLPIRHPDSDSSSRRASVSSGAGRVAEPPVRKPSTGNAFSDDRRQSMLNQKIGKRSSIVQAAPTAQAGASSSSATPAFATSSAGVCQPPKWYLEFKVKAKRDSAFSQADTTITRLKEKITAAKSAPTSTVFGEIRNLLHELAFQYVDGNLLRAKRILHNDSGLPQLFDPSFTGNVQWPFDVRSDAEELYNKWCEGIFEINLYRGIKLGNADSIDKPEEMKYKLMNPKTHGNGKLLNGQWWPTQLCAVVAGAHGATIAGITGDLVEGAYSVVMSGGLDPSGVPYPNIDNGDAVQYCGTDATKSDGQPSAETRQMILNSRNGKPVRLIRSSKLGSEYAPEKGYRYDGLYRVTAVEQMDPAGSQRQRHRFTLVREPGQDPIRSAEPEKRPTRQEIDAYSTDRSWRGKGK